MATPQHTDRIEWPSEEPREDELASDDDRLPQLAGGWEQRTINVDWTEIAFAVPCDPDALLADEAVQEASRRDDYMPYWASLWPAATLMARLLEQADWPDDTRMLELGCGLGLVGIAGLLRGWDVVLSDYDEQSVVAARVNAQLNGFPDVESYTLDWREPMDETFPVILACDVIYEVRNHEPLLLVLDQMLDDDGVCWLADPGRTPIVDFYHAATSAGFDVTLRCDEGLPLTVPTRGKFQVLELRR